MFSIDDVRSILDDAKEMVKVRQSLAMRVALFSVCVQESAARELERHANMAGLVLEQVFASAIVSEVELVIDLSRTEDAGASVCCLRLPDEGVTQACSCARAGFEAQTVGPTGARRHPSCGLL